MEMNSIWRTKSIFTNYVKLTPAKNIDISVAKRNNAKPF